MKLLKAQRSPKTCKMYLITCLARIPSIQGLFEVSRQKLFEDLAVMRSQHCGGSEHLCLFVKEAECEADLGIFPGIDITIEIRASYSALNTDASNISQTATAGGQHIIYSSFHLLALQLEALMM